MNVTKRGSLVTMNHTHENKQSNCSIFFFVFQPTAINHQIQIEVQKEMPLF